MSDSRLTCAFVMDPIESVDVRGDTTFVLMLEARRRGHRVLYVDPQDVTVAEGQAVARARPVLGLRREQGRHVDLGDAEEVVLDAATDLIFQRVDPPVDAEYITTTQILSLCRRALVLNRPEGILAANEKLYALRFADLMPETRVSQRISELRAFMAELGGEMIVKPLDGRGGEGIFLLHEGDRNLVSILEQSTAFEGRRVMAQAYLPAVRKGDKRIILLEGQPIGAVLRVPEHHESRANFHAGGRPAKTTLTERERQICARLAPELLRYGIRFAGIDVIGDWLTEVNVTSPTGVQEINALDGVQLERQVLDAVEKRLEARRKP